MIGSDVERFRFELFDFLVLDLPRSSGPHLRNVSLTIIGVSSSSSAADFGPGVDFFDALAAYLFCPVIIEFCSTAVFCSRDRSWSPAPAAEFGREFGFGFLPLPAPDAVIRLGPGSCFSGSAALILPDPFRLLKFVSSSVSDSLSDSL